MNQQRRNFDWVSFLGRLAVALVAGTWLVAERVRDHDRAGVIVTAAFGYGVLPAVAYFWTRYYNLKYMGWLIEGIRRRNARQKPPR